MRTIKAPEDRRNEILDTAEEMFATNGYDNTSVQQILDRIGIAKGTFYYYFKSKEELLDGIISRYSMKLLTAAKAVAMDENLSVHEKLLQTLLALRMDTPASLELLEELHKPQNALLHQKLLGSMIKEIPPILSSVIREGIAKGIFHTDYPYEASEMLIVYSEVIFDNTIVTLSKEELAARVRAFLCHIELLLGAEKGSSAYIIKLFRDFSDGEDIAHE